MKRLITIFALLALPAAAQENRGAASAPSGGNGGGAVHGGTAGSGAGPARSGGGGGGGSTSGGGSASSGGSTASGGTSSGGGHVAVGGRHAATGGSGVAVSNPAGSTANGGGTAVGRREGGTRDARTPDGGAAGVPPHARPRDGNEPITGTAVPRGSVPPPTGGGPVVVTGYPYSYPWWFGGAGYYGGYYGGYYDPWFGGYDPQPGYSGTSLSDEGALRLKIKPREAEVYVDGYYVGIVDDFDGIFQKLHIESGNHRIEVRAPGYEPLTFDVRITPDHSTTYHGELKKIQ